MQGFSLLAQKHVALPVEWLNINNTKSLHMKHWQTQNNPVSNIL